jgi:hypothetical protein
MLNQMVLLMPYCGRQWSYSSSLRRILRNAVQTTNFMIDDYLLLDYANESINCISFLTSNRTTILDDELKMMQQKAIVFMYMYRCKLTFRHGG